MHARWNGKVAIKSLIHTYMKKTFIWSCFQRSKLTSGNHVIAWEFKFPYFVSLNNVTHKNSDFQCLCHRKTLIKGFMTFLMHRCSSVWQHNHPEKITPTKKKKNPSWCLCWGWQPFKYLERHNSNCCPLKQLTSVRWIWWQLTLSQNLISETVFVS